MTEITTAPLAPDDDQSCKCPITHQIQVMILREHVMSLSAAPLLAIKTVTGWPDVCYTCYMVPVNMFSSPSWPPLLGDLKVTIGQRSCWFTETRHIFDHLQSWFR